MRVPVEVREFLSKIGKLGGQAGAGKKSPASAKNGKLGGRPSKYPKCPKYRSHRFSNGSDRCACGYVRHSGRR